MLRRTDSGFAFEHLHGDEELSLVLADLVDLTDVGVVDAGRRARLAPESPPRGVRFADRRHHLQRDGPLEALVARRIHHTHAAFAELALDAVVADARGHVFARAIHVGSGEFGQRLTALEPFVERAEPPTRRIARHKTHDHSGNGTDAEGFGTGAEAFGTGAEGFGTDADGFSRQCSS